MDESARVAQHERDGSNEVRISLKFPANPNSVMCVFCRKSVKAALMLIPLLGIPNIMQTIPFTPTQDNIMVGARLFQFETDECCT